MKKRSADPARASRLIGLLIACSVFFLAVCLPAESAHAEKDSSVTDYLKENSGKDKAPEGTKQPPASEEPPAAAPGVGLSFWDYLKTGLALLFVIALIYGMVKVVNTRNRITRHGKLMKNMGGLSLGQQKSIQLVQIGERYYLVGVGEDVRLLKELTDSDEIAALTAYYADEEEGGQHSPILALLDRLKNAKRNPYQEQESPADFGDVFKTKLAEIENERKRKLNQLTEKERNRE
ncbi:flagellar biosynthetic protein FliZ [Sporosarcina sp. NCCP-2716]|uniref:flagellar biosynthetic protein FliO n=1 Tax=Sporosarcina sp. NCCP-2716 TaxID=2943679 RepID=UPI00203E5DD6|nr:flagellar biosynthetic protein FliO [Sporosarcina sp. NCCP-2716]GKV67810.1 flagellar biosynthetic protein FliZ [Sporosarcina sp. NCCP-2716]